MQLPKEFTTVTTMTKILALVLFVTFPLFGFLLEMNYQLLLDKTKYHTTMPTTPPAKVGCTADAKACPDGTYVGRVLPSCDFEMCPVYPNPTSEVNTSVTDSVATSCTSVYGGMVEGACNAVPATGRKCQTDSDCTASCSRGCINANWTPTTRMMECAAIPDYSCTCVKNQCQKQ